MKNIVYLFVFVFVFLAGAGRTQAEPVKLVHNGLNLVGEFVVAEDRKPSDNVTLLLHGTLAHLGMETIKGLQDVLTERGHNTLSINLSLNLNNRTGMYDCAVPHRHLYGDAVGELTAWLDWLAAKGVKNVTMFGHSRGAGQVALFDARKGHDLVKQMVLMAPGIWNKERAANLFQRTHGRPLEEVLVEAHALSGSGEGNFIMERVGFFHCLEADVTADSFLSYYEPKSRVDTTTLLSRIKLPVLVVAAGQDEVVPDVAEKVKPLTSAENLQLAIVEDAGHFFLDLFAEDVADAIEEFLDPAS